MNQKGMRDYSDVKNMASEWNPIVYGNESRFFSVATSDEESSTKT